MPAGLLTPQATVSARNQRKVSLILACGGLSPKQGYFALGLWLWSFRVFGRFAFCGSGRFSLLYARLYALVPVQVI